ncbi:MAG: hypothetical protein P1U56_15885 [Saprospiraceae bacterium]|nr:hypothetical protein [Saprospiraceae bacterium]
MKKHAIYGNLGAIPVPAIFDRGGKIISRTAYYEHMIKQNLWKKGISSFVKVGIGNVGYHESDPSSAKESDLIMAQFGLLFGAGKNHLEIGASGIG